MTELQVVVTTELIRRFKKLGAHSVPDLTAKCLDEDTGIAMIQGMKQLFYYFAEVYIPAIESTYGVVEAEVKEVTAS